MSIIQKPLRVSPLLMDSIRWAIHLIAAIWLVTVYYLALNGEIKGDPVQYLIDFSGMGILNLLLLSLLISPLAQALKFQQLMALRKTLGVYAATYAIFHLYVFVVYELQLEWLLVAKEIAERPYITVGFAAFMILSSLLVTSFNRLKRKMGRRWQQLHNWIYLAAILGCIHFYWSVKSNITEPLIYILLLIALLLTKHRRDKFFKKQK